MKFQRKKKALHELTLENFEAEVLQSSVPVLVDIFMQGCGPCSAMAKALEEIQEDLPERMKILKLDIAKVNVQKARGTAMHSFVKRSVKPQSVPCLVLISRYQQILADSRKQEFWKAEDVREWASEKLYLPDTLIEISPSPSS